MRARWISALVLLMLGCGGSEGTGQTAGTTGDGSVTPTSSSPNPTVSAPGYVITIANMAFTPRDLRVPPGATVTVVNADGMAHSVTSEASSGAYAAGAVNGVSFDTGAFSSGQRSFTIPASAPNGTVIPFFCTTHLGTMTTPNGSITVDRAATPSQTPAPAPAPAPPLPGY